jgi:hypothetical protein
VPDLKTDVLLVTATKVESKAVLDVFERATGRKAQPTEMDHRAVSGAQVFMTQSEIVLALAVAS